MHILVFPSETFIPPHNHLSGIFEYHQAKALVKSGLQVGVLSVELRYSIPMFIKAIARKLVLSMNNNSLRSYSLWELIRLFVRTYIMRTERFITEKVEGITVVRVYGNFLWQPNEKSINKLWKYTALIGYKRYVSEEGSPDLIHCHNCLNAGILASVIKKRYNINFVLTEHRDIHAIGEVDEKKAQVIKYVLEESAQVIVVGSKLGAILATKYNLERDSLLCVHNLLDSEFEQSDLFESIAHKSLGESGTFGFINIASCDENKNQKGLLEAFSRSFSESKNITLRIVGTGELLPELKSLCSELNIEDQVSFDGRLSRSNVRKALLESHALILSSNYETFGVVLIEAMACGRPVVATACGGPNDLVESHNGLLVPIQDVDSLSAAMKQIYTCYQDYDSSQIRSLCLKKYGSAPVANELISVYAKHVPDPINGV